MVLCGDLADMHAKTGNQPIENQFEETRRSTSLMVYSNSGPKSATFPVNRSLSAAVYMTSPLTGPTLY